MPGEGATGPVPQGEVTTLLQAWSQGDAAARDRLLPIVYSELRRRAAAYLRRERRDHTLKATDLVHEAYLRLCGQHVAWECRDQFFGVAASLMRRVLVDHARTRGAAKRGRALRVTLGEADGYVGPPQPDLLDLDSALDRLAALHDRQARLVELRFFGGLTLEESAQVLGVSLATANREWASAKAWLYRRLKAVGVEPQPDDH